MPSQINGCSYCIDMHTKDARARGETEQRLYALAAKRRFFPTMSAPHSPGPSRWLVADGHVPDAVYEEIRDRFTESDVAALTMAVIAINAWNRVAISQRSVPGGYVSNVHAGR